MKTVTVSAMEYEGLRNLEIMVRIAMNLPSSSKWIVRAIQTLNAIRRDAADDAAVPEGPYITDAPSLAEDLIERAMRNDV